MFGLAAYVQIYQYYFCSELHDINPDVAWWSAVLSTERWMARK